ncbi:acyl-CoA carboxylase subunit beta [Flavobacteriaceae bacterium]|nr:acyl-CoA carboxylase subunit beta [Flavobacteriaceae bacterium]MDC0000954.1 acyl-CoA carboxylase subunit beta [Flavobacteriaceae bacterium]MDC1392435.1 acyl-CoA carboxylase subunit beta [Flavobacteriaceae bacterium]
MNLEKEINEDALKMAWANLQERIRKIKQGGGKSRLKRLSEQGKLSARERINKLVDNPDDVYEVGILAAEKMYVEYGGCPSAGVVVVIGHISKKRCVIVANDATVKAGAWFPMTAKKNLRAQEIAMENKIPIIYLVDSAGIFLPLQDQIFADKDDFGRIFRNNAKMSSMGIVQIAAIMGSCVAGGAYLPIMSDEAIIVEKTGSIFLAGSYLVKAAIGEEVDNEFLGGADTHSGISGVTDYKVKNDEAALDKIRSLIEKMGSRPLAGFKHSEIKSPKLNTKSLYGLLPKNRTQPYDTYSLLDHIVDEGSMDEYKKEYGQTLITSYAKIEGWSVGVIVNQRKIVKSKTGEMQFGGVIYGDAADKATRFIANCNQRNIPLVFLQDVTGFMVGSNAEHGGIIKDGAKMVNAVANSIVPKFTIIVGNSFGAGNYAMCGKAYDPRFMLAWPTAKLAVMGGSQAANVLLQIEKVTAEKSGNSLNAKKEKELRESIQSNYDEKTEILHAASQLWVDAVIKPEETRSWISMGIDIANHAPSKEKFNMGILQV